ncbi:MAG: hypothetical protein JXB32_25670 [Deltaproteobacteria bacterium]|nr:hypothetical protein [Deltaproteobacteria bacterium]
MLLGLAAALLPAACGGGDSQSDVDVDADVEAVDGDVPADGDDVPVDGGDVPVDGDADVPDGEGSECTTAADCNDDNPCTIDSCRGGYCSNVAAPDGTACDDGWFCTLPGTCEAGECTGQVDNDCDDGDPCTADSCDELMAECRHVLVPVPGAEGPVGDETCSDGIDNDCDRHVDGDDPNCVPCTDAVDCEDGNSCTIDTCEAGGICLNAPAVDGTTCDDELYCTVEDACSAGVCTGGGSRDCSAGVPTCNLGACDEDADRCTTTPLPDGTSCNDGLYCTVGETCAGGMCGGATPRDCSSMDDGCNVGVCDDAVGGCVLEPRPNGTACDDGLYCNTGEVCTAGVCGGGAPVDCSSLDDACNVGRCDEAGAACYADPRTTGTPCSDGDACTEHDACAAGVCVGTTVDCSAWTDACNTGVCDPASGCRGAPVADGTACNDGVYCTVGETCTGGTCGGGTARDCGDGDPCTSDSCSEALGRCDNTLVPVPGAEGPAGSASCGDGIDNDCDRATDGLDTDCAGCTSAADCNDLDPCTTDACTGGHCVHGMAPDGTSCNDGLYCTTPDTCASGVCGGAPRDCSASGDQCNVGRCDEGADTCYADPRPNGTACNDGLYCTNPDACTGGVCGGPARDCSSVADQCNTATCNEGADRCDPVPRPNGTACSDGLYCTTPDTCTGGVCSGPARDCSSAGGPCAAGTCNEATDACVTGTPSPDGTVCDADSNPATRDICLAGTCAASACGDGFWDAGGGEFCDDGNTVTETCYTPPIGSCVRDCSIRQDTCGDGTLQTQYGETCDPGLASPPCDDSCLPIHHGVGAACTCTGSGCRAGDPTVGTITGCEDVVVPTGARLACYHSDVLSGNNMYFPAGYCGAYAHRCTDSIPFFDACAYAGIPANVGSYSGFVGPCPTGSVLVSYTVSSSGVTVQIKACFSTCDADADCRWNEEDTYWDPDVCGHYECITSPSTPGTRICFDTRMAPP